MIKEDLKVEPSFLIRTPALRLQSETIKTFNVLKKYLQLHQLHQKPFLSVLLGTY